MTFLAGRQAAIASRDRGELQYHHITLAFLAAIAAFMLIEPIYKSFLSIYLSYNGGWNAYHALRAVNGENLYAFSNPLTSNNYPPLSFFIVGGLGNLLGDHIFAGRLIALLAFFAAAANIGVIVFRVCRSGPAAAFAALFFIATIASVYDVYVGINDPQMLGHAFMTGGVAILISAEERRRNLFLCALLLAAGGFVKHNLIALPIAVAIFLAVHHRRAFFFWLLCSVAFIAVGFGATTAVYGSDFIDSLDNPRRFSLFRLGKKMLSDPLRLQIPIVFWALYTAFTIREKYTLLIGSYVVIAGVAAIAFSGGDGVSVNIFFDLVIGLSIAAGLGLDRAHAFFSGNGTEPRSRLAIMTLLSLSLCFGIMLHVPVKAYRLSQILPQLPAIENETVADIEYLARHTGPVFCESLALCFEAEKSFEVDAFHARQLFLAGEADENLLLDKLRSGYYDAIQLGSWEDGRDDERMSHRLIETLKRCYRIDRISANGAFFTPGPNPCAGPAPVFGRGNPPA